MSQQTPEEEIDNILGDVLETMDEADNEPLFIVSKDGKPKVNIGKFDKLLEAFDIGDGNMSNNIQKTRDDTMKELEALQENNIIPVDITTSIVNTDELILDHILVREALREDIAGGRIVAAKLAEEIATADMDQLNGQVTEAYASIKKANVMSMKLLIDSYTIVAETQNKIKKLASELKTLDNQDNSTGTNIEQAIFVGSPAELLQSLKNT